MGVFNVDSQHFEKRSRLEQPTGFKWFYAKWLHAQGPPGSNLLFGLP
jgi:hypothetical protein